MNERKNTKLDALILINTGEHIANLLESATGLLSYDVLKAGLKLLLPLKDVEGLEFIGQEAKWLLDEFSNREDSEKVDYADGHSVRDCVNKWRGKLSEISNRWILSSPDTHIDATKLNKGVRAFLSDSECNTLEPIERHGLEESASSLLFNNFTSAEFMALRTAESLLKRWYEKKTGKKLGRTTWGQVLDKLNREYPKKEERPKELILLDYLRERRNKIAHPGGVSNSVQASTTFFNVISLCQTLYLEQS
jgi:hypothetical protein